jgi:hypothetical protein
VSREQSVSSPESLFQESADRLERFSQPPSNQVALAAWLDLRARDFESVAVFVAIAKGAWAEYRNYLRQSGDCIKRIFEIAEEGAEVSTSLLSMSGMWSMFLSLASGDMALSRALAAKFGGRDAIEKEHDLPFTRAMGYLVRDAILESAPLIERIGALETACKRAGVREFSGYVQAFAGMEDGDSKKIQAGLERVIAEYPRLARPNRYFFAQSDKFLCLWGIGVANLALERGLLVMPIPPLIPAEALSNANPASKKKSPKP